MTHHDKVQRLIGELGAQGLSQYEAAPRMFRWLWSLGIELPPPIFMSFWLLVLFAGAVFGVGMFVLVFAIIRGNEAALGLALGRSTRSFSHVSTSFLVALNTILGVLFGLLMAFHFRRQAKRFKLSDWRNYGESV